MESIKKRGRPKKNGNLNQWAKDVKGRDGWECVECGSKNQILAHHIKPKEQYPDLDRDIRNGLTLCKKCHSRIHREECSLDQTPAKRNRFFVRIDPDLKAWLETQADKARRSISDYVRIVLGDHRKEKEGR